ncbi:MAG: hypothetical protein MMC23_002779 [Stictis urceolatum]|nr:hypothetical protein [Stictis urceolata]
MVAKRKQASTAPASFRRNKIGPLEEIPFDFAAREEYLTGFHKRKLQRAKHAQEQAAKREREERIATRKALRESRKAEVEKHVHEINAVLKEQQGLPESDDSESSEAWDGIEEPAVVNHEDEYIDEDKYTTVTVEEVDITKEGMRKVRTGDSDEDSEEEAEGKQSKPNESVSTSKPKRTWTKDRPAGPKKKKKKFRYESKADRKVTRMKERSSNKAKAKERRG